MSNSLVTLALVDARGEVYGVRPDGVGAFKIYDPVGSIGRVELLGAEAYAAAFYASGVVVEVPLSETVADLNGEAVEARLRYEEAEAALRRMVVAEVRDHLRGNAGRRAVREAHLWLAGSAPAADVGEAPPSPKGDLGDDLQGPPASKGGVEL